MGRPAQVRVGQGGFGPKPGLDMSSLPDATVFFLPSLMHGHGHAREGVPACGVIHYLLAILVKVEVLRPSG